MNNTPQLEVLDLRHFSGAQLAPLLREESTLWEQKLLWDYTKSSELLREYLDGRILPGLVALHQGRVIGYTFCVYEGVKGIVGDIFAIGEAEADTNPVCDTLLHHLLETLQSTPGVDRIESQLLLFSADALAAPFLSRGFRAHPRLFMMSELNTSPLIVQPRPIQLPGNLRLYPWRAEYYDAVASLIYRSYVGHMDATINDQYRTLQGAQRFLHNIIRFPGCGAFATDNSWVLRDQRTFAIEGAILSSRVRYDTGHVTQVCISPELRHQGLGHFLLQQCAQEFLRRGITKLSLTVTEANTPALELYKQMGFKTLHRFDAMVWDSSAETA